MNRTVAALAALVTAGTLLALPAGAQARRPTAPVVVVVLDELPLVSLLDGRGQIDPVRYPNLAALARNVTWYA
nr:hypothetical protein [Thermoleophilaceae bacterium]